MATQPVLASTTLPHPAQDGGFRYTLEFRGGRRIMADGSVVTDLVTTVAKHAFTLQWKAISSADLATIKTAHAAIKDAAGSFTSPENVSYTVAQDSSSPDLDISAVLSAGGVLRWDVSMRLRQD